MERQLIKSVIGEYLSVEIDSLVEQEHIYDLLNRVKLPDYGTLNEDRRAGGAANILDLIYMIIHIENKLKITIDDSDEYETLSDLINLIINKNKNK